MFAAATMLFGTSCSEDQLVSDNAGDEAVVSFTLNLSDGIQTKAISDGTTVEDLVYCVYDKDGNKIDALSGTKDDAFGGTALTTTVNFTLVKGQTYSFSFWAQDENAPYTHNGKTVTVNYENATTTANDENRDAFYAVVKDYPVTNSFEQNVTLTRPFAQLNYLVTGDELEAASKAGFVPYQSSITLKNVATTLNMFDATVSGSEEVTFGLAAIPAETELTKVKKLNEEEWVVFDQATGAVTYTEDKTKATDFRYLATTYLLVNAPGTAANDGKVKSTLESTSMTVVEEGGSEPLSLSIPNVPVQWNYRTNIFGSLLTANGKFYIEIDPAYEEDSDYTVNVWDGVTTSEPELVDGYYEIASAAQWAWLKGEDLKNNNIKLVADIDFAGNEVKGLGFTGEFDGNGHTMSNMTLLCGGSYYSNGLFQGDASGEVTVKDLTIQNVVAECADGENGYVGAIFGDIQSNVTLSNVHVVNADFCGVQSVGGLVGLVANGKTLTIENCSVNDSHIYNYAVTDESGQVGSLVGKVVGTLAIGSNVSVSGNVIDGYYCSKRKAESIHEVAATDQNHGLGTITGLDNVRVEGVTVNKTSMDNVQLISTAAELGNLSATDKTVVLTADIDFAGTTMTKPIEIWGNSTFDGQGHKISNVVAVTQGGYAASLFRGDANAGTKVIKNLVVEGITAQVTGDPSFAAVLWSDMQNGVGLTIDNVHISGANISSDKASGGFVGFIGGGSAYLNINNSSITNSNIVCTNTGRQGALVGRAYGCGVTVDNVEVSGVKVGTAAVTENTLVGGENSYTGTVTIK